VEAGGNRNLVRIVIVKDLYNLSLSDLVQLLVAALVTAGGAVIGVQRVWRSWSSDKVSRAGDDAQASIIHGLQLEAERLHEQNAYLVNELYKMQQMTQKIIEENLRMQTEIGRLQQRLSELMVVCGSLGEDDGISTDRDEG
jgi:FtsZ-binding cell division protein ZapB